LTLETMSQDAARAVEHLNLAECSGYLRRMAHTSKRLRRLVNRLLDLSREPQPGQAQTAFRLADALAAGRGDLADLIRRQKGRVRLVGAPEVVRADRERVTRLLANLVGNGLRYNHSPEPAVEVGAAGPAGNGAAGWVTVSVRDNGDGIDPQFH